MAKKVLLLVLIVAVVAALCAAERADVDVGKKAPEFELFGVGYKYHSLADYPDAKAIVVVFTCNHCPVAKAYEETLIALAKEYQPKGIQFLAINPNPADMVPAAGIEPAAPRFRNSFRAKML